MRVKAKWLVLVYMAVLFSSFIVSTASCDVASAQEKITTTVTYEYYVVAGYNMTPTPPDPELVDKDPAGFDFTVTPEVFNFGNVTLWGGRSYLYDGFSYSPYTNMKRYGPPMAGATVNITNLGPNDVTILALTAEVTDGTITNSFFFTPAIQWFDNWTMVIIDTLDPGDYDECDYYAGLVEPHRLVDGDRYNKIRPGIPPEDWEERAPGYSSQGPGSLLRNDTLGEGDAAATGHVAPIPLAVGATFTEYFGVILLGSVDSGTQIDGTIRLALTYEYTPQPGDPIPRVAYSPTAPVFGETVTFDATESEAFNGTTIQTYAWDFGDETTGTGMIVNHTFATPRLYTVDLTVTDTQLRVTSMSIDITIGGLPVAMFNFTPNASIVAGKTVTFNASASRREGGSIVSYAWDFGDESTDEGKIVTHKYAEAGDYTVVLNITDSRGLWDTEYSIITVEAAESELPVLWILIGVGVVVAVVVVALVVFLKKRK